MRIVTNMPLKRLKMAMVARGVDPELFDVRAMADPRLSYRENVRNMAHQGGARPTAAQNRQRYGVTVGRGRDEFRQRGRTHEQWDQMYFAMIPGRRYSQKTGRRYYERRRNRSDYPGRSV